MRYKYLKLVNFKRFPLRDCEVFEHEFTSKLLMITGPNGAGKSSAFNELTPLPADKANFYKDGYKEIHIEQDKKQYTLISDFRGGASFSFLIDGQEANQSGNVTTQRDLVFLHFNITPAIHDLLVGNEVFTEMSLLARKKLFAAITHLNIDKVLENYNALKEELKNNELLLKSQTSLLQAEEQKLVDTDRLTTLKQAQERSKEFIEFLLEIRAELHRHKSSLSQEEVYQSTKTLYDKIRATVDKHYLKLTAYPKHDLQRYKLKYTSSLNLTTYQLTDLYSALERKQDELRALAIAQDSSLTSLQDKQQSLMLASKTLSDAFVYFHPDSDTSRLESELYKLEAGLPDILRTLPLNIPADGQKPYSKDRYERLLDKKKELLDKLAELSAKEISLNKELSELSSHTDQLTCPNCEHTWSPKDVQTLTAQANTQMAQVLRTKALTQQELTATSKHIEEITEYFTLYRHYSSLRNDTKESLKTLWQVIDSKELVFIDPPQILVYLRQAQHELIDIRNYQAYQKELSEVAKNIALVATVKASSSSAVELETQTLLESIDDAQQYKTHLQATLSEIKDIERLHSYLEQLTNALKASVSDLHASNLSVSTLELLSVVDSDLSKHKVTLIEIEQELHQHSTIQYTIEKYRKSVEESQTNIKVLNLILDELSPKNGLIAKSVSSFLNIIITNINATISGLWEYKMVLKAIDVESDSLSYKFKVEVEDKLPIDDISKISKGMKEAVNLSFKIILYRLLGLEGTPLYLDELGSNLDKVHSEKLLSLIHQLSTSEKYSQIFIITHKENYGFLKDIQELNLG